MRQEDRAGLLKYRQRSREYAPTGIRLGVENWFDDVGMAPMSRTIDVRPKLFQIQSVPLGGGRNMPVVVMNEQLAQYKSSNQDRGVVGVVRDVTLQAIRFLFVEILASAQADPNIKLDPEQAIKIAALAERQFVEIEQALNTSAIKNDPDAMSQLTYNKLFAEHAQIADKLSELKAMELELAARTDQIHSGIEAQVRDRLAEVRADIAEISDFLTSHQGTMNDWRVQYEIESKNDCPYKRAMAIDSHVTDATNMIPIFMQVLSDMGQSYDEAQTAKIVADFRKMLNAQITIQLTPK